VLFSLPDCAAPCGRAYQFLVKSLLAGEARRRCVQALMKKSGKIIMLKSL